MRLALKLARRGLGRTRPNPPVGAVVVRSGRVVGEGFHRCAGAPHAEVEALRAAGKKSRGATLYVTLEPCNHAGRTPPCSEAILAAGIREVVVGARDLNPAVTGGGAEELRAHGISVSVGVCERECAEMVAAFHKHSRLGLPLVTLKLAASLDGRIATSAGLSRWITGPEARRQVHRLRNEMDAVMIGARTAIVDDPELTCRIRGGRDPIRVIVDGRLRLPLAARVLANAPLPETIIATTVRSGQKLDSLRARGATVLSLPGENGQLSLRRLMRELGRRDISSVLLEGGATLASAALREKVVDRFLCYLAPLLIGGDGVPMIANLGVKGLERAVGLNAWRVGRAGSDLVIKADLYDHGI